MAGLSKSRIMSSLQCLKRVHLEIHRKDLLEYSKATEAAFAIGHESLTCIYDLVAEKMKTKW